MKKSLFVFLLSPTLFMGCVDQKSSDEPLPESTDTDDSPTDTDDSPTDTDDSPTDTDDSPTDTATDTGGGESPQGFENSEYYGLSTCESNGYYWAFEHLAVKITPPAPPWQLSKVKVHLLKENGCNGEVLVHAIVSTDDKPPTLGLIPYIEDRLIKNIVISSSDWSVLENGSVEGVEVELDVPLLVEEEGDLFLVLVSEFGACPMTCLSETVPALYFDNGAWELMSGNQSLGLSAELEW